MDSLTDKSTGFKQLKDGPDERPVKVAVRSLKPEYDIYINYSCWPSVSRYRGLLFTHCPAVERLPS